MSDVLEPTDRMIQAGLRASRVELGYILPEDVARIYAAMQAAAFEERVADRRKEQVIIRVSPELKARAQATSRRLKRSLTGLIESYLEDLVRRSEKDV